MIKRTLETTIQSRLFKNKAIILMGPRQVGKTTLIKTLFNDRDDILWLNGDEQDVRDLFENISSTRLKAIIGTNKIVVIDEAQRISDIGIKLKLITDQIKDVQLVATGSSSFELANLINEPLTGRKWEYKLLPVSFEEMSNQNGLLEEKRMLQQRMIYGYYPEIVTNPGNEKEILAQLADSYLYRDILTLDKVKKTDKIVRLLQALAFQLGSEVSYNELAQLCGLDSKTVEKYVTLLEQSYIIFRLGSFSSNLRNELRYSRKIYFTDNGIRNALISNFSPLSVRTDAGQLWESFMIAELLKKKHFHYQNLNHYFWRTYDQQEVDLIETKNEEIKAYEFKWSEKKSKIPTAFSKAYPNADFQQIHQINFLNCLL